MNAEGESYLANNLQKVTIPLSSKYIEAQFKNLAQQIGTKAFDNVASIHLHMQVNSMPIYSREFFSSNKKIRWLNIKEKKNWLRLKCL